MQSRRLQASEGTGPRAGITSKILEAIQDTDEPFAQIAARAGVNPRIVARFATGKRATITLDTADRIAGALGLRLVDAAAGRRTRPGRAGQGAER